MKGSFPPYFLRTLIVAVLIGLSAAGCASIRKSADPAGETTDKTVGDFTGTWWNYYKRALLYADQGRYREAEKDLQQALQGNDVDRRNCETPDGKRIAYFPHRELGILHYLRKEYTKAVEELSSSIESEPSARARYFLDQARSGKIERDGLDRTPPVLRLEECSTVESTANPTKHVTGVAKDDTFITSVTVGGESIPLELSTDILVFTADVPLQEGLNTIPVTATDLSGKSSSETLQIYRDTLGPLVEIAALEKANGMMSVSGNVSDAGGLVSLRINGHKWPITGHFESYNFQFAQPEGTITVTAKDRAGNMTEAILDATDSADGQEKKDKAADPSLPDQPPADLTGKTASPPRPDPSKLNDSKQPSIRLDNMFGDLETFNESIEIRIRVTGDNGLDAIFVNTSPILPKIGRIVFFSIRKRLRPGKNEFRIVAVDRQGNKTDRRLTVTRKVENIYQSSSRMKIAVLPFTETGNTAAPQFPVTEKLAACLAEQQRFQTAEPQTVEPLAAKAALDGTISPYMGTPAGVNLHPTADAFLAGSVKLSSGYGEIVGRLIDTRTDKVMDVEDVFGKIAEPRDIDTLACRLVEKFTREFPVRQGMITEMNGEKVSINLGAKDGIKPYSRFIIYRDSPPFIHPVTNCVIQPDPEIVGSIQVTEVQDQSASAEIISTVIPAREYDRIMSR